MSKKKKRRRVLLLVNWVDSFSQPGWKAEEDIAEMGACLAHVQSVGFFVKETKRILVLGMNRSRKDQSLFKPFADIISIPKGAITRRRVLRKF